MRRSLRALAATREPYLALAAGLLLALSAAPHDLPALALGCPTLLYLALPRGTSPRRALALGLLTGLAVNAVALSWVVGLLEEFGRFPWFAALPTAALLYLAQALPFALAAMLFVAADGGPSPRWLSFAVAWQVAFACTWTLFPWRPSAPLVAWPEWSQLAELGGASLLDLLLGLGAALAVEALRRRRVAWSLAAVAMLALPPVYGALRLGSVEAARGAAPELRIGVVQPNVGIHEKHDPATFYPQLEALREATAALEAQGAELVVWPESAYPFPIRRGQREEPSGPTAIHRDGVTGPVLFGALTIRGRCERYNSTLALDASGRFTGVADKVRLLAFGEYIPFWRWLPFLHRDFPCPGLSPGERPGRLHLGDATVDVLNCFEDVPTDFARLAVNDDAGFLLNVTNDAWFGDTAEPHLHQMVARLRAIETRRDLVRVVNTGVSAHISATGELLQTTPTFEPARFIADVRALDGETFFTRVGDCTTPLAFAWLLCAGLAAYARRRRTRVSSYREGRLV